MERNAVFYSNIDKYKGYVGSGIVFRINKASTYEEAYNEIKDELEAPEMIEHIIEDKCLLDDLFEGDKTYKFKRSYWNCYSLHIEFENSKADTVLYSYSAQFVYLAN